MKYFVDNLNDLILDVYTIGYSSQGESQVIIFKEKSKSRVILSFVIDCFSYQEKHITMDILASYNIETLDYFIWTHTDEDHSIGIANLIESFCNNKTQFILPEGVSGNERDFINYNQEISESFSLINSFNQGQNYNVNTATVVLGSHQQILKRIYIDKNTSNELIFEVLAIAPISPIIRRRWEQGVAKKKNDVSIATRFNVGELSLLFSGDIENQSINHIPGYLFDNLSFIKTPHHTSPSSDKLIYKLEETLQEKKVASATSTVYTSHKLPNQELIKKYLKHVDSFSSTGSGENGYGYIKTTFSIISKQMEESLHGDAVLHN